MAIGALADFNTIIDERGETVSWYSNTIVKDAQSGSKIDAYGSATSISAIIVNVPKKDIHNSAGELTDENFYMYCKSTRDIAIKDKIVWNTNSFKVEKILNQVYDGGTLVFRKFLLRRLASDA